MIERRQIQRERRTSYRAPFVAAVRSATDEAVELALAVDLSRSGMRLRRAPDTKPLCEDSAQIEGPVVHLEFELPDGGEALQVAGRLLFERSEGSFRAAGVRFLELGIDDELRIASYVAASTKS